MSPVYPSGHPKAIQARSSLQQRKRQRRGHGPEHHRSAQPRRKVHVQFTLPGHEVPFLTESTICWLKTGHIGLRFVSLSQEHKSELQGWLSRKLEEMLPELVAGKFRRVDDCSATTSGDREQG